MTLLPALVKENSGKNRAVDSEGAKDSAAAGGLAGRGVLAAEVADHVAHHEHAALALLGRGVAADGAVHEGDH